MTGNDDLRSGDHEKAAEVVLGRARSACRARRIQEIEDVTQRIVLRWYDEIDRDKPVLDNLLRDGSEEQDMVKRIIRSEIRDYYRRLKKESATLPLAFDPSAKEHPEAEFILRYDYLEGLRRLPPRQQTVIQLRESGKSVEEIAAELGVGERTVYRELSDADEFLYNFILDASRPDRDWVGQSADSDSVCDVDLDTDPRPQGGILDWIMMARATGQWDTFGMPSEDAEQDCPKAHLNCADVMTRLLQYHLSVLREEVRDQLSLHLGSCAGCTEKLNAMRDALLDFTSDDAQE